MHCQSYVGESSGHEFHPTTKCRDAFEGGRQASSLPSPPGSVDDGQLSTTDCPKLYNTLCRATCIGKEVMTYFPELNVISRLYDLVSYRPSVHVLYKVSINK